MTTSPEDKPNPMVNIDTNYGSFVVTLDSAKAPKTVENFLQYVQDNFYNNTLFHRVIDGFMIQGGGFEAGMNPKKTYPAIENEAHNGLKNDRCTIAMARTADPHSATAQFFINVVDNPFLNFTEKTHAGWGYTVFGAVTKGMDVVDKIKTAKTQDKSYFQNVPAEDIIIKSVSIIE